MWWKHAKDKKKKDMTFDALDALCLWCTDRASRMQREKPQNDSTSLPLHMILQSRLFTCVAFDSKSSFKASNELWSRKLYKTIGWREKNLDHPDHRPLTANMYIHQKSSSYATCEILFISLLNSWLDCVWCYKVRTDKESKIHYQCMTYSQVLEQNAVNAPTDSKDWQIKPHDVYPGKTQHPNCVSQINLISKEHSNTPMKLKDILGLMHIKIY